MIVPTPPAPDGLQPEPATTALGALAAAAQSFGLACQHVQRLRHDAPPELRRSGRLAAQAALVDARCCINFALSLLAADGEPAPEPPAE